LKLLSIVFFIFFTVNLYGQDTLYIRGVVPIVSKVLEIDEDDFVTIQKSVNGKLIKDKIRKNEVKAIKFENGWFEKYKANNYFYAYKLQMIDAEIIPCIVLEISDDSVTIDADFSLYFVTIPKRSIASISQPNGEKEVFNKLAVSGKNSLSTGEEGGNGPVTDTLRSSKSMDDPKLVIEEFTAVKGDAGGIKKLYDLVKDKNNISDSIKREIIFEYCKELGEPYFTGRIENGMPVGKGELFTPSSEMQSGEFVDGKLRGEGYIITKDSTVKRGLFLNGQLNGEGIIVESRYTLKGKFKDGQLYGRGGVIILKSGGYESGQYDKNRLLGVGERHFQDSNFYKGDFNDGKYQGQGEYRWIEQNVFYKGGFKDGERNGLGIMTIPDGIIISGEWKNDCPEGEITIKKQTEKPGDFYTATWMIKDCKVESKNGNIKKIKFNEELFFIKMTK